MISLNTPFNTTSITLIFPPTYEAAERYNGHRAGPDCRVQTSDLSSSPSAAQRDANSSYIRLKYKNGAEARFRKEKRKSFNTPDKDSTDIPLNHRRQASVIFKTGNSVSHERYTDIKLSCSTVS
jgi:hypothetical protein